ncbi:MAG: ribosome recycling factor [bacterium]|jgi:ribosome recycling factor
MEELHQELKQRMSNAVEVLQKGFQTVRTGRANPAILDGINVDYYGTPTALSQVGNISVPDPQLITITPWEKSLLSEIEKAILKSDLGVTPQNDGNVIRLPVPPLTEDRRKDLVKKTKKMAEDTKLAIRNVRRDGNEKLKKLEKEKEISQDEEKVQLAVIQKVTDEQIKRVDDLILEKESELMEV